MIGNGPLAGNGRRIWLVFWPDFRQPGFHEQVLAWMNARHRPVTVARESRQLSVALYERGDGPVVPPGW